MRKYIKHMETDVRLNMDGIGLQIQLITFLLNTHYNLLFSYSWSFFGRSLHADTRGYAIQMVLRAKVSVLELCKASSSCSLHYWVERTKLIISRIRLVILIANHCLFFFITQSANMLELLGLDMEDTVSNSQQPQSSEDFEQAIIGNNPPFTD